MPFSQEHATLRPARLIQVEGAGMLKSKGVVRRIIDRDSQFLVSFPVHACYFQVEDKSLREKLRAAHRVRREVSFTYDANVRILSVTLPD
jgi:hypothetical protein